ncbi:VTT domain-containing protein [Azospirillum sp. TSO35-2]|uniref:VTT domain-containing protein n=1 Tax=Azospirillum sp. TSO35-2 TaxID=716796 RepID=UPI000D620C5C|nr:VTT domain-containing protein [Azospirillum sp. TSO35-2]PWC36251.1 phospholipase [Azospirillum sp. TSO35-2]
MYAHSPPPPLRPDSLLPDPAGAAALRPILEPGRTCWRVEDTARLGVVIDAEDYFALAKAAMRRARRSIYMTAWDFDARIRLMPQTRRPRRPDRLGHLLNWLATTRPDLHIHVLKWDYAELFDIARWSHPFMLRNWLTHRRLQYRLDGDHPTGACHHQKLLVIDDRLAFCGGLDVTANRWDTRAHHAHDPRRRQPDGKPYEPFHDIMMAVDGDAARALGDMFRDRWARATGETLAPPAEHPPERHLHAPHWPARRRSVPADPWPPGFEPMLRDVRVGIARTDPACNGRPAVREIEALYLEAIAAAREVIYFESQYFASTAVADALKARLAEEDGPEVVVVNPVRATSWLENTVMLGARARLTAELRAADRHGRFRLYAATTDGGACITVHAKVMVVDDRMLRIGSANLNNRSMGLDTECDLALEAGSGPEDAATRRAIRRTRDDLIAEHLGSTPERVAAEVGRRGSLVAAIEALRRPDGEMALGRTLEPLHDPVPDGLAAAVAEARVFDPEHPVDAVEIMRRVLPSRIPRTRLWVTLLGILAVAGLWGMWRYTALKEWATLDAVLAAFHSLGDSPFAPLWVMLAYIVGGYVMFPLTLLIAATAIVMGPWWGFPTAMGGAVASAAALFWTGRFAGRDLLERHGGPLIARINDRLSDSGIAAVAGVRAVPVAPYTVVNLAAGASKLRFADYVIGTMIGLAPGILAFNLLGHQLERTISNPDAGDIALLTGMAVVAIGLGGLTSRLLGRRNGRQDERKRGP